MTNPTAEEVELENVERTALVEKYEAYQRLKDNKDFQRLVLDGYLKDLAVDHVSMLATEHTRQSGTRGVLMERLVAISAFEDYLFMIENLGAPVPDESDEE